MLVDCGRFPAPANVELRDDGTARVACGTQDIGTGTYTILALLVARSRGPVERVEVALGDSQLPPGPLSGGSMATGPVVPAVLRPRTRQSIAAEFASTLRDRIRGRKPADLAFEHGKVFVKADGTGGGFRSRMCFGSANMRLVTGNGKSEGTLGDQRSRRSRCIRSGVTSLR